MTNRSDDIATQKFIDSIKVFDETKYDILMQLRDIVFDNIPEVMEKMMYGGIIFYLNEDFGGVFVYENHLSFEFSHGFKFKNPDKLLEGKGKYRRHLKIRSLDDIETKKVDFFIKQAGELLN